jgi:hypothetical protein
MNCKNCCNMGCKYRHKSTLQDLKKWQFRFIRKPNAKDLILLCAKYLPDAYDIDFQKEIN